MDIKACLLTTAWLLPLVGFAVEIFGGYWSHHAPGGRFRSRLAAYISVGCIGGGFLLSLTALVFGVTDFDLSLWDSPHHASATEAPATDALAQFAVADEAPAGHGGAEQAQPGDPDAHEHNHVSGRLYELATFGKIADRHRLLHRQPDAGDVHDGHADRHLHPRLCDRVHG